MKKIIYLIIITLIAFGLIFGLIYFFNQAKGGQKNNSGLRAELDIARQNLEKETKLLQELRGQSYFAKVSAEEYAKIKKLVERTNIFFDKAESATPKIIITTPNKVVEAEINTLRARVNNILIIWAKDNNSSTETDQALLDKIKDYLLIIQSYLDQLQDIVSGLTLSGSDLDNYNSVIQAGAGELQKIQAIIDYTAGVLTENTVSTSSPNAARLAEIEAQIKIVQEAEKKVKDLEKIIDNPPTPDPITPPATTTLPIISSTSTPPATSTDNTSTSTRKRPKNNNPQNSSIIYTPNPRPYEDNGVDVDYSAENSASQDFGN